MLLRWADAARILSGVSDMRTESEAEWEEVYVNELRRAWLYIKVSTQLEWHWRNGKEPDEAI
jgi:uncharacterized membrane protein YkvA (DUF1232 family)